jgi:hypothetical protein
MMPRVFLLSYYYFNRQAIFKKQYFVLQFKLQRKEGKSNQLKNTYRIKSIGILEN